MFKQLKRVSKTFLRTFTFRFRSTGRGDVPPPQSNDAQDLCKLFFYDLDSREDNTIKRIQGLKTDDAQGVADFVQLALLDLRNLTDQEVKNLLRLLKQLADSQQVIPRNVYLKEINYNTNENIRDGEFTTVYKGAYHNRLDLCIKVVKKDYIKPLSAFTPAFSNRLRLDHDNIVPLYGVFAIANNPACIITPWITWNLEEYVEYQALQVARFPLTFDIIAGLEYLHQSGIIHGNLKGENVLVSSQGVALLADYGLYADTIASLTTRNSTAGGDRIAGRWMAPEILKTDSSVRPTKQSDVWSFGCVFYQVASRLPPYHDKGITAMLQSILRGDSPVRPHGEMDGADLIDDASWALMRSCWNMIPEKRPQSWRTVRTAIEHRSPQGLRDRDSPSLMKSNTFWKEVKQSSVTVNFDIKRVKHVLCETSDAC